MKIYLVTSEWQINGDHAWDNYAFAKKEDAEKFIEEDKKDVLVSIDNGEYGGIFDDMEVEDFGIYTNLGDWFQWDLEELELQ